MFHILCAQFPVDLAVDEVSAPLIYQANQDSEFLLTLTASSNTNWSLEDSESSTLVVAVDGNWENYNQDIVLYAGDVNHKYYVSLGYLDQGEHTIEFKFDYNKSSTGAEHIYIESADIVDIQSLDIDPDILLHSPILYGRDLLSWNESTHTDIPLIMFYEYRFFGDGGRRITYSIIFSNEDSRVGLGLADLMFSYGRTTDIEWMYEVYLDVNGNIISETFQGPSHITTEFSGEKVGKHPILKNATLNCNFIDYGISDYKFYLAPIFFYFMPMAFVPGYDEIHTREIIMDENPWTYRIMGEELINENRYEINPHPETVEMSDIRNYVYVEYYSTSSGSDCNLELSISFFDGCQQYFNTHQADEFSNIYTAGLHRTSIELPENFNPDNIEHLGFNSIGENDYYIEIPDVSKFFYLDSNYNPVDIPIYLQSINVNNDNPYGWLYTYNDSNIDCAGDANGSAECDDCGVCNGSNNDMDDCGICFGNNINIDCSGVCFGLSTLDECGICDDDASNDNVTCSGCTDINADNFDEAAVFYDGSCIYTDNMFLVPDEYVAIQNAIFFASDGDTIKVGEGIYEENIHFLEKSIIVQAQDNLEIQPIIQGVDSLSTVIIENSLESALIGFTIQNGYGRGVSFDDFISLAADPIVFDSLITNVLRGGGLSIINSNVELKDLNINNNMSRNVGAGIGLINSLVTIESTAITNNVIPDGDALGGGGIAINGGDVTLVDVDIFDNTVGSNMYYLNGGGGVLCGFSFGDSPLELNMYNTTILNNSANIGAGLGALSGNIYMDRAIIAGNSGDYGSAISMGEPLGLIISNINMNIINSTIANNMGLMTVGLINSAYLNILNSIFWNNDGEYEFASMPNNDQVNVAGFYSIFETEFSGEGNLTNSPLFIDSENYNFHLTENSPCIDSGINSFNFDDGSSYYIEEYYGYAPDMGAYEFIPNSENCDFSSGDVNIDGVLDILDILQVVNVIMGFTNFTEQQICIADINEDYILDIFDIIIIINIILST